jgi:hypothetical protein
MLSFRVLPRSILDTGTNADLPGSGPSRTTLPSCSAIGQTVCKLVTPTTPTDPTDTLYLFSFQSLAEHCPPSRSNGTPFISFNFISLQTIFLTTDRYTPSLHLHRLPLFQSALFPAVDLISLQPFTKCPSSKSFVLITIHFHGGVYPSQTEYVTTRTPSSHALCLGASVATPLMMYPVPGFSVGSDLHARKRRTGIHRHEAQ